MSPELRAEGVELKWEGLYAPTASVAKVQRRGIKPFPLFFTAEATP
jgi:hypothetical protein